MIQAKLKRRLKNGIQAVLLKAGLRLEKIAANELDDSGAYAAYPPAAVREKRFYNVGAGGFYHPTWTNIDYESSHYAQIRQAAFVPHDLMALGSLPLADDSAAAVYSSHTIEHVSDAAVLKLLKESYRILTRGGVVRLTAPDAALDWRAYRAGDADFWYWRKEACFNSPQAASEPMRDASVEQLLMLHLFTQLSPLCRDTTAQMRFDDGEIRRVLTQMPMAQAFDYFAGHCRFNPDFPGNHINWWTAEKAERFLREAGFEDIYLSAYGQSACPPMRNTRFFDNTMPKISFYIEAVKH